MIFYSIIFFLSVSGGVAILIKNREEFEAFNFSSFMNELESEIRSSWQSYFKPNLLLYIEKRLHGIRIFFLKAENKLFRITRRIRGIQENGNGNNHSESEETR
ncbi:hypothetical protein HYS99_00395 [Candidatus Giovannonibacteria bacterium]|nr:hypothetical protein [Candidatus Giovannonibacteria bacterium]